MTFPPRKLPISESAFRALHSRGFCHVDKTPVYSLTTKSDYWFLFRPRRFGKTLRVISLQALFEGHEPLFRGLHIHNHWDQDTRYAVVRLSFDANHHQLERVTHHILTRLAAHEQRAGIRLPPEAQTEADHLQHLIGRLHEDAGQPVMRLVGEYDQPIRDVLEQPELIRTHRDVLRDLATLRAERVGSQSVVECQGVRYQLSRPYFRQGTLRKSPPGIW